MIINRKGMLASWLMVVAWVPASWSESPGVQQLMNQSREMVSRGELKQAIELIEASLEGIDEADHPVVIDQLRKFYTVAVNEARKSGQHELAEHYAHNLKVMDAASGLGVAGGSESPAAASASGLASAMPHEPMMPGKVAGGVAIPKASAEKELGQVNRGPGLTDSKESKTIQVEVMPPGGEAAVAQAAPTKIQQFDLAEADNAFRAKKYEEAGKLYQQLIDAGNLPESRRGHLAYCRAAGLVERINKRPTSASEWQQIEAELKEIQKIQPEFWFAEYLNDLVKERQNRHASVNDGKARGTQLASHDGSASGLVNRAANQIKSINPLRRASR